MGVRSEARLQYTAVKIPNLRRTLTLLFSFLIVIVTWYGCDHRLGEAPPEFETPIRAVEVRTIEAPFGAGSISGVTYAMNSNLETFDVVMHYEMLARARGWHRIPKSREAWVTWCWVQRGSSASDAQNKTTQYRAHWASEDEVWSLRVVVTESKALSEGLETQQIVHTAVSRFAILNENGEIN